MKKLIFKIYGMDCTEEIAVLKQQLKPLINKQDCLSFDLLAGRLTIETINSRLNEEAIISAIAKTDMQAVPWRAYLNKPMPTKSLWRRHGRTITAAISAISLISGFLTHLLQHDIVDSFISGETTGHSFPFLVIGFYTIAIVSGAWFIFPKALLAAKRLRPDMNLLMVIAVFGAVFINQWFEAATVTFLFSFALLLESWSVGRARNAISALMELAPDTARIICKNGAIEEQPAAIISIGSAVLIKPGEKIPLDGVLTKGMTSVNQAPITGESMPVTKEIGDELFAGTINGDNVIEMKTTKIANDSTLSRIIQMVENARSRRAKSEQWVETFARYYTPAMILFALIIAVIPPLLFGGTWSSWFYESLVILVIACPCALVISTPVSIVAGLNSAAHAGVLIKGGIYLEAPAKLTVIALDKTGTLTRGKPIVQNIIPLNNHTPEELLGRAAALEAHSEHPLAKAILAAAKSANIGFSPADNFQIIKGKGAQGYINGRLFWIGSHRFLHEKAGQMESETTHQKSLQLEDAGHSVVAIGNDQHICGLISIADTIRPETKTAIAALKKSGIKKTIMLTGDNDGTARSIAAKSKIDEFKAELLPEDKVKQLEALVKQHRHVAMVGDGVNDAPAMAVADLGIAMGAIGSDAAIETADIALMSDDLTKLAWLVKHSRRTINIVKQNICFALAVKTLFISLALMGIATLWMAIAADTGASLIVIANGLRLLKITTHH